MVDAIYLKPVALTAGILGILQGVVWFVLALLAILSYSDAINISNIFFETTFSDILTFTFSKIFRDVDLGLLTGTDLLIWATFYMLFSVLWIIVSIVLIIVVAKNSSGSQKIWKILWAIITLCICALDFSLTIAFGVLMNDYNFDVYLTSGGIGNVQILEIYAIWSSFGILMTIAARGFILWVINLILAILLVMIDTNNMGRNNTTVPQVQPYTPNNPYAAIPGSNNYSSPWTQIAASDYNKPANPYGNNSAQRSTGENSNNGFDWDQGSGRNIPRLNPAAHLDYPNSNPVRVPTPDYPTSPVYGNRPKSAFKYPAPRTPQQMNRY